MVGDVPAAERAYQHLKREILSGQVPAGPLDIKVIGDQLRMSVTPVREALARLGAERLVRLAPHQGYQVAVPSARRLEELYDLSGNLICLCLDRARRPARTGSNTAHAIQLTGSYAADLTALLGEIAASQQSGVLSESVLALNEQLYPARRSEPKIFTDAAPELAGFAALWTNRNIGDLKLRIREHFRMRVFRVDAIARLLSEESGAA